MSFTTVSISAAPFIPLSASYRFDDKIDLKPTLYQYDEGYSFFHHPYNIGAKDVNFANDSFFEITSAQNLVQLLNDVSYIDPSELVLFTGLKMANGNYITNNNNTLYATATALGQNEFFRVIRNGDGTYSISQNDLYATVLVTNNDMRIEMKEKLESDPTQIQKFMIYSGGSQDIITIRSMFIMSEWSPYITKPIERFWSFFDGNGSNMVKAIGLIENQTDFPYVNDYKILATVDLQIFALGFDGKVIWVKYYNELLNKFFNKTVDIKDFIEDVQSNYLVEYPYKTKIDLTNYNEQVKMGNMKINLITLKNIMTPEYDYNVKRFPSLEPLPVEWTPEEISTIGWYDASDASTITTDIISANKVAQWSDKSGNDYHMTNTFGASSYPTTNIRTINGLNAIFFNDELLYHSASAAQLFPTNQIINVFYVVDVDNDTGTNVFFMAKNKLPPVGSDGTNFRGGAPASATGNIFNANLYTNSISFTAFPGWMDAVFQDGVRNNNQYTTNYVLSTTVTNAPFIGVTQFDRSNTLSIAVSSRMNGGVVSETNTRPYAPQQNIATAVILGSNGVYPNNPAQKLNGVMGEVIITHGNLNIDTRDRIEGYLAWKWNIVSRLPSNHPYKNSRPYK